MGGNLAALADAPEGNCGRAEQRVLRTLGRMRALTQQLEEKPRQVIDQYIQRWEDDLGEQGRPRQWRETNRYLHYEKFHFMKRCHALLGQALEQSRAAAARPEKEAVTALIVQCLNALHEFFVLADWGTAWPLTLHPEPLGDRPPVGSTAEMEDLLSALQNHDGPPQVEPPIQESGGTRSRRRRSKGGAGARARREAERATAPF